MRRMRRPGSWTMKARILKIVNNYSHQLQLRSDAARVGEGAMRRSLYRHDRAGRPRKPRALLRPRLGDGAGYNHMIMPLANSRDKYTQIVLGHRGFPVSLRTRARKACGCRKPRSTWRRSTSWRSTGSSSPSSRRYQAQLRSADRRREVDGCHRRAHRSDARLPCTTAVRQDDRHLLLRRPDFAGRRVRRAAEQRRGVRQPPAERVLGRRATGRSWCTSPRTAKATATITAMARWRSPTRCIISSRTRLAKLTNYGEFLEKYPADARSRDLREHGVELRARRRPLEGELRLQLRWARPDWNQEWRGPLREALDWLRDDVAPLYEKRMPGTCSGSVGGARRVHPCGSRPLARGARRLS